MENVVIAGGGLAGLTLALQIKQTRPETTITILEFSKEEAPTAAHKVGESTVELGTHYLREVLGLKDYLDKHQLPKHGLRFFFSPHQKLQIENRVELGPRKPLPILSHQLDRGLLENQLIIENRQLDNTVIQGAKVMGVNLSKGNHAVAYEKEGKTTTINANWLIDATGRNSFLKRKLGFQKPMQHAVNAVWFRVKGEVDVDDWSTDTNWNSYLDKGLRRLSTVHFMDTGYWVWLIPLSSGNTSIGIVADPSCHDFSKINTLEKAYSWLQENEPLCHKELLNYKNEVLDFRVLRHYAHHTDALYSTDNWGVTGEAGAFLDPLYSPGTDFIAMNNCWLTDLVTRELNGEDVALHTNVYEQTHLALVDSWIPVYKNKYSLMGNTQVMVVKIFWDWATYWSVPTLLFTNKGYTNISVLRKLFSTEDAVGRKFGKLNECMQNLFSAWNKQESKQQEKQYIDPFDLQLLQQFQYGIGVQHSNSRELTAKITENINLLEQFAVAIYQKVAGNKEVVNPYTIGRNMEVDAEVSSEEKYQPIPEIIKDVSIMFFGE